MPVEIKELHKEHDKFYYNDDHFICIKLVLHAQDMLKLDLVTDAEGNTLNSESPDVKTFLESEEVLKTLQDEKLFGYVYENISQISGNIEKHVEKDVGENENPISQKNTWIKYYDEPKKRVFYK